MKFCLTLQKLGFVTVLSGGILAVFSNPVWAGDPAPEPLSIFKDCDICPEMVVIPPGEFLMGSDEHSREQPVHQVTIARPFAIGRAEVTIAQWQACIDDQVCSRRIDRQNDEVVVAKWQSCTSTEDCARWEAKLAEPARLPESSRYMVGWKGAMTYISWLSDKTGKAYRLPSEAEWEYAARGGTQTRYWWGNRFKLGMANCEECRIPHDITSPSVAGEYPANPFGLFDVSGSLEEWVEDCWNPTYLGAHGDGSAKLTGTCRLRVIRGGSRFSPKDDLRITSRYRISTFGRTNTHGLRVARDLD